MHNDGGKRHCVSIFNQRARICYVNLPRVTLDSLTHGLPISGMMQKITLGWSFNLLLRDHYRQPFAVVILFELFDYGHRFTS